MSRSRSFSTFSGSFLAAFSFSLAAAFDGFLLACATESPTSRPQHGAQNDQRNLGQAGEHHQADEDAGDHQRLGLGEELAEHFIAEVGLAAGAGDDQAGGEGDDERGNLADQAVADGQLGVELRGNRSRLQPCSNMPT